jgi:putative Mg2+ transporter-C (MgtC) family protein
MILELFGYPLDLTFLRELLIAYALALPIAFDRERSHRSAGLRTFPIVSVASCGFLLIARDLFGDDPQALARVVYGLMTGIGFIGGGAIVKQEGAAHGTATAASIWSTGAVGLAVAFDRYGIAISVALVTFLTLFLFRPIKQVMGVREVVQPGARDEDGAG